MRPTSKAHLWDAQQAALKVLEFTAGLDESTFRDDDLVKSAVERQLEILGEALNRLRKTDDETAKHIPDIHRIIAMRNVLAHEYGVVDYSLVWAVVEHRIRPLHEIIESLLSQK